MDGVSQRFTGCSYFGCPGGQPTGGCLGCRCQGYLNLPWAGCWLVENQASCKNMLSREYRAGFFVEAHILPLAATHRTSRLQYPATNWEAEARLPIASRVNHTGLGNPYHGHNTQNWLTRRVLKRDRAGISIFINCWFSEKGRSRGLWHRNGPESVAVPMACPAHYLHGMLSIKHMMRNCNEVERSRKH